MEGFLDPFLESSIPVGEMPSGTLLLHKNAHYQWFIIVPQGDYVEWVDLPEELQQKLLTDMNALSEFLRSGKRSIDKINLGSIGNIVPRFHLHILSRRKEDPAWPGPVWGHPDHKDYTPVEVDQIVAELSEQLPEFTAKQ